MASRPNDEEKLPSCCRPGKDFHGAIWRNGAFAGEFGDPHIQNTDLEGGQTAPSIRTLSKIIENLLVSRREKLTLFEKEDVTKVKRIIKDLLLAAEIDGEKDAVKDLKVFPGFIKSFQQRIEELKDGQRIVFTGGWSDKSGGHAIMHMAEREKGDYIFCIINTGQGVEYHPSTKKWFPKTKHKVAIAIKGIPPKRFLDPAVWLLFWKLRVTHKKENDMEQMYEVLLPHLANGPLAQAVQAAEQSGFVGDYETIQRSGTCYYRCVLSTLRYLMKRDGFSALQRKQFFFQIRCAYLDRVGEDLVKESKAGNILKDSDVRMIRVACNQTAMAALKEQKRGNLDSKGLGVVQNHINRIQGLVKETSEVTDFENMQKLGMEFSNRYIAYAGFGLVADDRKTDGLKGGPTEAVPELFVDLFDETPLSTFDQIQNYLLKTKERCDRLRAKTSVSAGSIACHQIACLIQTVFTVRVPVPTPEKLAEAKSELKSSSTCPYLVAKPSAEERLEALKALQALMLHYAAATMSTNMDRADESSRAICIMAVFDAILRMRTSSTDNEDILARVMCGEQKDATQISGSNEVKGYSLSVSSFQGYELQKVADRMMFTDPNVLEARHKVFQYFERMPFAKSPALFSWKPQPPRGMRMYPQPTFQVQEDDTTMKFTKGLLEQLDLMFTIPPRKKRGRGGGFDRGARNPDAMTEIERMSRWIMGDSFPKAPEILLLRDIVFLHKLLLEPAALLKLGNEPFRRVSLWFLSQASPQWEFHDCNRDGTVSMLRVSICNQRHNIRVAPGFAQKSPADLKILGFRENVDEDGVLQKQRLERFGNTLSEEESEKLMTYLTAPYLAIPLVLEFFSQERVGSLLNPWLRDIFESVLFEPHAYTETTSAIEQIPVEYSKRGELLGTPYGVLMHEAMHSPGSLLAPLESIVKQTLELCIGDYTSTFATLLLRVARVTYYILRFVRHARTKAKEQKEHPSEERIMDLLGNKGAMTIIYRWLGQSEAAGDVERSTEMHAVLAMLHALRAVLTSGGAAKVGDKAVSDFCCSTSFVLSWHSQAKGAISILNHFKDPKRRGQAVPLLPVPLHDVFLVYENSRQEVCRWAQAADSNKLDQLLGRVASVSLQRANPGEVVDIEWRGWNSVASKPLVCSTILESAHPYKPSMDYYQTVRFPGAPYISIYFDEKSSTEEFSDFVTIYKDESCTTFWGKERKLSGPASRGWPGAGGRPPLVIPADFFVLHFHSDRTVEDWGFRLTAAAPVSAQAARTLSQEQDKNGQPVGIQVAQHALMKTLNDTEAARKEIRNNLDKIKEIMAREGIESKLDQEAKGASIGLYRDPMGTVQVNLQTAEVYLRNRMLMPVPADIANHRDFHDVFDAARAKKRGQRTGIDSKGSAESLFCAIVENNLNRKLMTIVYGEHVYEVGSWTPIISNEMAQNMSAQGSLTLQSSTEDEKTAKDEKKVAESKDSDAKKDVQAMGRLGGLPEQRCLNMPRRAPGSAHGLLFDGKLFVPYYAGSASWVSGLVDPMLEDSIKSLKMESKPKMWISKESQDLLSAPQDVNAKSAMGDWITPSLCAQLLMYVEPQGELEELKGHPGGFFEIQALQEHKCVNAYCLVENGRRLQRQCVFSSDSRVCLRDLPQDPSDRDEPQKMGLRFSGGGMFDELLNKDGSMADRAGVGKLSNNAVGSLVIRRNRLSIQSDQDREALEKKEAKLWGYEGKRDNSDNTHALEETDFEEFVPGRFLAGLIPDVLISQYQFWRSGPSVIRAYPRLDSKTVDPNTALFIVLKVQVFFKINGHFLSVDIHPDATWGEARRDAATKASVRLTQVPPHDFNGTHHSDETNVSTIGEYVANVIRVPHYGGVDTEPKTTEVSTGKEVEAKETLENDDEDNGAAEKESSVLPEPMLLLNPLRAVSSSLLGRVRQLLCRIENLSHVLIWSRSQTTQSEEECEVTLVELPRLGARFETRMQDGKAVLASLDYDGLFIAEEQGKILTKHAHAIPHAIVLNNTRGEFFLMIPNYGIQRPKIKQCPFSTDLVLLRGKEWAEQVKTRYYVYPIHLSGTFVLSQSLSASLYLLILRLMARDYIAASKLISTCATDTAFSDEEKWIVSLVEGTEEDSHPNAHACRLRLACLCQGCGEKVPTKVKDDKSGYLKKFPHVSEACRLTLDEEIQLGIDADRLRYLQAVEQASKLKKPLDFPAGPSQSKQGGSMWYSKAIAMVKQSLPLLAQGVSFYFKYSQPSGTSLEGHGLVTLLEELFDDSLTGQKQSRGLMLMYQLLTGAIVPRLFPDVHQKFPAHSLTLAKLAIQMKYLEATKMGKQMKDEIKLGYSMLIPVLHAKEHKADFKGNFPELPFFKVVGPLEEGMMSARNPALAMWVKDHLARSASYVTRAMVEPSYPSPPSVNETTHIPADAQILTRPEVTDCSASQRCLLNQDDQKDAEFPISKDDRKAFFTIPLSSINLKDFILMRPDMETNTLLDSLPFKIGKGMAAARSHVAKSMLQRMENDMKTSAERAKGKQLPRLACLTPEHLEAIRKDVVLIAGIHGDGVSGSGDELPMMTVPKLKRTETIGTQAAAILVSALDRLHKLKSALEELQKEDQECINTQTVRVESLANFVEADLGNSKRPETERVSVQGYTLEKFCGKRVTAPFEHIASMYLSSQHIRDMKRINPFLTEKGMERLMGAVSGLLFRCTRLSHCNRTIDAVKNLEHSIQSVIVKRLEEGWLRGSRSVYELMAPTQDMLLYAAKQSSYDETKTRILTKRLLQDEVKLLASMDRSGFKAAQFPERLLPAAVAVAFHLCSFDLGKTEAYLASAKQSIKLIDLARRNCYLDGTRLWVPDPAGTRSLVAKARKSSTLRAMVHIMDHTAKTVASLLTARRGYTQMSMVSGGFDPRFLAFEFMAGFMMRPRQVEIIFQFLASAQQRVSSVRQMIMGAGKTSVVSPMLTLLLANGRALVTQVVPKALLAQTRIVMRRIFSNVISKPIYTFNFDRGSETANSKDKIQALYKKLDRARKQRAVVCTTPEALKSLMLRYVDLLQSVEAASPILSLPASKISSGAQRRRANDLAKGLRENALMADAMKRLLKLWSKDMGGVALLDEVDLILHPLKSELNFPIGPKERLPLGPERWLLPMHILEAFFYDASGGRVAIPEFRPDEKSLRVLRDIATAMRAGEDQRVVQTSPHPVVLQKSFYETSLKASVSAWALIWLTQQRCVREDIEKALESQTTGTELEIRRVNSERKIGANSSSLEAKEKGATEAEDDNDGAEYSSIGQIHELLLGYISDDRKLVRAAHSMVSARFSKLSTQLLNLARDWIGSFLPHCLSKINRVAYGLLHTHHIDKWSKTEGKPVEVSLARRLLAVPFVGLDVPSRAAEFAHPEVQIGLSVLAYRYEGLRRDDVRAVAQQLKETLVTEQGPYPQRPSRMQFQDWLEFARLARETKTKREDADNVKSSKDSESYEVLPLELFQYQDDKQLDVLHRVVGGLPDAVSFFLRERVFDRVMRHQSIKLRASGADLGSDVLFGLRLGFSGTPSDLLPRELRPCFYEPGSEAKIVRVLTDPKTVTHKFLNGVWSVESLLMEVASPGKPAPYKALIDTGALITGLTNEQVARKLLHAGLEGLDACVFLDESDRKVVVDRTGGRPVPLSRCGVSPERYFTFYDQVHTTGMDIRQALDAQACVTLGKDMTLRDYAQGCYRLRGLARGQTLCVLIVDEVKELIARASKTGRVLNDVVAWLLTNSMRSENLQHLALSGQLLNNVWRKQAWRSLMSSEAPARATAGELLPSRFRKAIVDKKEAKVVLEKYSVLTDADRKAEAKKKEEADAKKKLEQILLSIRASGKQLPFSPQDVINQSGSLVKGVGALADIAKSMGVEILESKELKKRTNDLQKKKDKQLGQLRMITKVVKSSPVQLPVPLEVIMGQFGNDLDRRVSGITEFVSSCGIQIPSKPFNVTVTLPPGTVVPPQGDEAGTAGTDGERGKEEAGKIDGEPQPKEEAAKAEAGKAEATAISKAPDEEAKRDGAEKAEAEKQDAEKLDEKKDDTEKTSSEVTVECTPAMLVRDLKAKLRKILKLKLKNKLTIELDGKELKVHIPIPFRGRMVKEVQTLYDCGVKPEKATIKASWIKNPATQAQSKPSTEQKKEVVDKKEKDAGPRIVGQRKPVQDMTDEEKLRLALELSYGKKTTVDISPSWATKCIQLFREPLEFNIPETPPQNATYSSTLRDLIKAQREFLNDPAQMKEVESILNEVEREEQAQAKPPSSEGGDDGKGEQEEEDAKALEFDAEMVQEQEKEQEQEQRQEIEQEVRTAFASSRHPVLQWGLKDLASAEKLVPRAFYPLRTFSLNRKSGPGLPYPKSILLSENFAPLLHRSDLARRMKNASVLVSWRPDDTGTALSLREVKGADANWMSAAYVEALSEREVKEKEAAEKKIEPNPTEYCVTVSLSEAECLRRALEASNGGGRAALKGTKVALCTIDGLELLAAAGRTSRIASAAAAAAPLEEEPEAAPATPQGKRDRHALVMKYQAQLKEAGVAPASIPELARNMAQQVLRSNSGSILRSTFEDGRQCVRFFDNQMWFDEDGVIRILRALADAPESRRRALFDSYMSARRRDRTRWDGMPVAQVFAYSDERHLMRMRDLALRVSCAVVKGRVSLVDIFQKFDANADGWLSQAELTRALMGLNIGLTEEECAQLLRHADASQDGFLNYREFAARFGLTEGGRDQQLFRALNPAKMSSSGSSHKKKALPLNLLPSVAKDAKRAGADAALLEGEDESLAHMSYAELSALGTLSLASGGLASFHDDSLVSTRPGYRPTICPRGICIRQGKWYYEVTIVTAGRGVIGWSDSGFRPNFYTSHGTGDGEHSWGVDGVRRVSIHKGAETPWEGPKLSNGDVLGVQVEIHEGETKTFTMSYMVNGVPVGTSFERVPFTKHLTPAVSFESAFQLRVNLGTRPWRYAAPAGCRSIHFWARRQMRRIHALNAGPLFGKLKPTTGDAQMTITYASDSTATLEVSQGFPTAVLQGCLITSGRWYYEFTVKKDGVAQVGWCDLHFYASTRGGVGVGDDKHSWGYDGNRILLWHNGKHNYGRRWKSGDVIGCAADLDARSIRFFHNGDPMGAAAENMEFVGGLAPGITLNPCALTVNFGASPFAQTPPPGHLPVSRWLELYNPHFARPKLELVKGLEIPGLSRSVSQITRKPSELKTIPLRASSGYTQALISNLRVSATSHYPSIVADRVLLTKGRWYYEVRVTKLQGNLGNAVAFVGWCDATFFGNSISKHGVGDDKHSWGWGVSAGKTDPPVLKHDSKRRPWFAAAKHGTCWKPRDVIGCAVDFETKSILFSYNGKFNDSCLAFTGVSFERGLVPAVSVSSQGELQFNFGEKKFQHSPPEGYASVHSWFVGKAKTGAVPKVPEETSTKEAEVTSAVATKTTEVESKSSSSLAQMMAATQQLTLLNDAMIQMQKKLQKASNDTKKLLNSLKQVESLSNTFEDLGKKLSSAQSQIALVLEGAMTAPTHENLADVLQKAQALVNSIEKAFK
eukprot:CAMPEP_0114525784 /NCGR_PEP_ID=MMETSP0109-20121206/22631_1 /TAXON_ID=29199 /ORGANISM="Chlorarachnion reptans, Strain CCCM449" /LENGTH=5518 /DNA_ID=CAMNT_0001707433 /DNA_START=63 /DNA_END=16619 /DNA_ORIENTATION=+